MTDCHYESLIEDCCGPPVLPTAPTTGPDIPGIVCYTPDTCCGPNPCDISCADFICAVRQLLPEGEIYNTTKSPPVVDDREYYMVCDNVISCETDCGQQMVHGTNAPPPALVNMGATAVCDNQVGSESCSGEQLIVGSCCPDSIQCVMEETAPQLAVIDSFAAVLYRTVKALCVLLCELDPCCATRTLDAWARRFGIVRYDEQGCEQPFPNHVLALLVCLFGRLRHEVMNLENLERLAALFGAQVTLRYAGSFNCPPYGWWSMARDLDASCERAVVGCGKPVAPLRVVEMFACESIKPESINIIVCPAERTWDENCNMPVPTSPKPHDPEIYKAFLWLLPRVLPPFVRWCVYECNPNDCIQ